LRNDIFRLIMVFETMPRTPLVDLLVGWLGLLVSQAMLALGPEERRLGRACGGSIIIVVVIVVVVGVPSPAIRAGKARVGALAVSRRAGGALLRGD
jgi:hypothetical protein